MIERLQDYRVTLIVDGESQRFVVLARSPNTAKLEAMAEARRLLHARTIEVKTIALVEYKPYA